MTCPNCKAKLGCSCKLRTATDGTRVCTSCITKYENDKSNLLKGKKP